MNFLISSREFWRQKGPLFLYVLSLIFSLGVFISLDSLQVNLVDYIEREKQTLVGGDIEISSNLAFAPEMKTEIETIKETYAVSETYGFSSMVSSAADQAVLSQVKVVSADYPLYGAVELGSKTQLSLQLKQGQVIVEPALLTRLNIQIGDEIQMGQAQLKVVDTIVSEPDNSLSLFGFGPRILVSADDIEAIDLLGDKSRVSYATFIKVSDPEKQSVMLERLKSIAQEPIEVESIEEAETTLSRFSDRFLLFLKLVIFSLLILTGIGIITILKSFLQSQRIIIATRKSLGETPRQILFSYLKTFGLWALVGLVGATLMAQGMILVGADIFAPIFPTDITLQLSLVSTLKSFVLGLGTTLLFATFALEQATRSTPAMLFRADGVSPKKNLWRRSLWLVLIGCIYAGFIMLEIDSLFWAGVFLGSIIGLFLIFWGIALGVLSIISMFDSRFPYRIKLVLRSLQRTGSATGLFLGIFTLSLTLFFGLIVIENTIQDQFVLSYPENAPNVFLLDIKQDQVEDLKTFFPEPLDFYPVIRAPIASVNNESIEDINERSDSFGDNITRSFNITYYDELRDTEVFLENAENDQLFAEVEAGLVPVSVLEDIANDLALELGDKMTFNIQGIEIATQVTSVRKRNDSSSPTPFFYFVFQPEVLRDAPQTLFATGRFDRESIAQLQTTLSREFPQISVLDTSAIGEQVGGVLAQLSSITRLFTLFNLFVGFIIFIASLMATSQERKTEAVFYRLQGMTLKNVWRVVSYEFTFIGIFTVGIAMMFAALVGHLILYFLFDLSLSALPWPLYGYAALMFASIFAFGGSILYKPLTTPPITFIRNNARE